MNGKAETPEMEEIRASISRIIADEEQGRGPVVPMGWQEAAGDVDAGSTMAAGLSDVPSDDPDSLPVEDLVVVPQRPASEGPPAPLLSAASAAAVAGSLAALGRAVPGRSPSLEEVVADMLRPMLKTWLDENLPGIVERLVQAEIDRLSRGGR